MKKKKIVIALGHDALGTTLPEQKEATKRTAKAVADFIREDYQVVITHSNGPQVGMINNAFAYASANDGKTPEMPFPEAGAMSQGYIGYHLQNGITNELNVRGIDRPVAAVLTRVVVNAKDPAFQNPTKPIGAFYTREEAERLSASGHTTFVEDSGRGYRRVVASPLPVEIQEMPVIRQMMDSGYITIAVGGGGIPITKEHGICRGTAAVIDKDFASELLAEELDADFLIILTAVEKVAVNFGKPEEKWLDDLDTETARAYIKEGHFAPGSMLPKVQAAVKFAESKPGRTSLITLLEKAKDGIQGKTGTHIHLA